tara:strand:- start:7950 stop:8165 length:216 start_codon:yes stop_codon:yes gene_type:complete
MNIEQVIELVEKWIADTESVSRKELGFAWHAAWYVVRAADVVAVHAVHAALNCDIDDAKYWVAEYRKITKE